ncbi:MAG TPA: DUF4383 domain-containing protein [Solirubrobacteraceae bacterium]|jgi:hypothetical protein|nr:DUF4383 domain-containing protein [Solirubrobacteraceae bacterium]
MATSARTGGHVGYEDARHRDRGRTPAQWYCLLAGAALLLAGILGFIADSNFDTGGGIDGDKLIGAFEVNGWHNLVHIASGLLLLAASAKRASAKTVALLFGVVYGVVALIGLIDGETVLGLLPVNPADNILHIALSLAGIVAALASDADDRELRASTATGGGTTGRRTDTSAAIGGGSGRDVDPLTGRARDQTTR